MDRNVVRFGFLAVIILVIFAAVNLYPPGEKLRQGLDLAGGTSLIYDIDTTGLTGGETDNLSQKLIPILMKRIDPGNVQNIIMRPQGDTRIELQVPLASADTHKKRQAYDDALESITQGNINLALIKRTLTKDPNERAAQFAQYAGDNKERQEILNNLSQAYDTRKTAQEKRDNLSKQLDEITSSLEKAGINVDSLASYTSSWSTMDANQQETTAKDLMNDVPADKVKTVRPLIANYFETYNQWAQVVNELTQPQTGLNAQYRDAELRLRDFNLNIDTLTAVLEMPEKSSQRAEMIDDMKEKFPSRAEKIDALAAAFKDYRSVRGRIDGPDDVKRMLKGAGVLEFRILPTFSDNRSNKDELLSYVDALKNKGPKLASDSKYVWVEIENPKDPSWQNSDIVTGIFGDKVYVLASNQKNETMLKSTGTKPWKLTRSRPSMDQMGKRAIEFSFDEVGGSIFFNITRNNLQRPLAIILDNQVLSAPNIRSEIRGNGIIEGSFSQTEQMDMVDKLNAGSLPARLIEPPISEKTIGPSIGADNREQGIKAAIIALSVVCAFLLVYYLLAGAIADIAIVLNIFFVLAIMAISKATFTLPGIAGLILTVGMSDDANILIYERIREEILGGASLRNAITNGYKRAFWTIFDSNLTTLITAVILYMVGSEEIKGFAITIILGLICSMFTGLFVTRIIFQWLLSKGFIRQRLAMFQIFRQRISINWMKIRPVMFTISAILVIGGLVAFNTRDNTKNNKYDIEFTGGTSVQIDLKPQFALERAQVEEIIRQEGEKIANPAIAAARVYSIGQRGAKSTQYEITTTETNKASVQISFTDGSQNTAQSVKDAIISAQKTVRGQLTNLDVTAADGGKFTITTSQTNKAVITNILNLAFGDKAEVSEPQVVETVTSAVLEAFEGKLQLMENLNPTIVSVQRIDGAMVDNVPELTEYLDGIKIEFKIENPVTLADMNRRFRDLQFKPDMHDIEWYSYTLMGPNYQAADSNQPMNSFIYVSMPQDAGFRQLTEDEWANYVSNETRKVTSAGEMHTSLSRVIQFAPSVGKEAKTRALIAVVLSLTAMIAYLWLRFGNLRYGLGAVIALTHDVCIALGLIAVSAYLSDTKIGQMLLIGDFKIDLSIVAALLTLVGYSVNDTIVVFDRIRENRGRLSTVTPELINNSINQTLSRTILTSFTTLLAVLVMYIWGGSGFRGFNFIMSAGIIIGTYSSIAIAAPILLVGKKKVNIAAK